MKKLKFIFVTIVAILMVTSCSKNESIESQEAIQYENVLKKAAIKPSSNPFPDHCGVKSYSLLGGQTLHMGTVQVVYVPGIGDIPSALWVKYEALEGYDIIETHLWVGEIGDMPDTKNGSPKIGHFDFANENQDGDDVVVYEIPMSMEIDECTAVVAHAVIRSEDGTIEETAWPHAEEYVFAMKTRIPSWSITGYTGLSYCLNFRTYPLNFEGTPRSFDLIPYNGGSKTGSVIVYRDGSQVEFMIDPDNDGQVVAAHLFAGTLDDLYDYYYGYSPYHDQNCFLYSSFPYPDDPNDPESPIIVELPTGDTGETHDLPGPGWGWYINFCLEVCTE